MEKNPITIAALLMLAMAALWVMLRKSDAPSGPDSKQPASPLTSSPSAISSPAGSTPRGGENLTALSKPKSETWSSELERVDMFTEGLECAKQLMNEGLTEAERPRFAALVADFRNKIFEHESDAVEVVENEDGASVKLVPDERSEQIAEWFLGELDEFEDAKQLKPKFQQSATYGDLTSMVRAISLEADAKGWKGAIVFTLERLVKEDGRMSSSRRSRVEAESPYAHVPAERYRHVIDIPATIETLRPEADEASE